LGKLRTFSGKQLRDLLAEQGFIEVRRKGSHIVMQKRSAAGTTTVVVPNHHEVRVGTLLSIIRQSQLPRDVFEVR
jgi:predicted RNA binding protein YcfA (HicA-like mRNA interferase family)